jgi:SprT protein
MCFEENIMDDRHVREWIRFACERNMVPELADMILVEWNSRFTKRLGDAGYSSTTFRARIRLSIPLWPRATDQDRRETIIHEACHIIVGFKHGFGPAPHGAEWKQAMGACDVEPLRTHEVDRTGLARKQRRFILLDCPHKGVEHKCRVSAKEFNRVQRGEEFWCKVCGLHLDRNVAVEEDRAESLKV